MDERTAAKTALRDTELSAAASRLFDSQCKGKTV
jgi:hypothetical protein